MSLTYIKRKLTKSKIGERKRSDTWAVWVLRWLELLNMGERRHYSKREVGREGTELWGVTSIEDQLCSPPSPSPSSSLASHHALAELLAVASQVEGRAGSWRFHGPSLGY